MLALAALGASTCKSRGSEPAGRVTAEPSVIRLAYPESVPLRLDWQPARALDRQHGRPIAFVHLILPTQKKNVLVRTFDHALPKAWNAGQPQNDVIDLYQSSLTDPIPPGRYALSLGLYDESWGYRWPLQTAGPEVARREYQVATVEVAGPDPSAPKFGFSGAWKPAESVATKQVLARRCFTGAASVAVEAAAAGTVRLLVTVPPHGPSQVRMTSSCASKDSQTIGPESQKWIGVGVAPGRCEIGFEPAPPTFPMPDTKPLSACLEVLSWRPPPFSSS